MTPDINTCPVCHSPAVERCRCLRSDSRCVHGHSWHRCLAHNKIVLGGSDHSRPTQECSCPKEGV